jgi:succinoglycan biosynthesis transport protein ExoP
MMLKANDDQLSPRDKLGGGRLEEASNPDRISNALGFAKRQFWIVLLVALFGTSLGIVFLLNAKPDYTATATVLIDTRKFQISQQPAVSPQMSFESSAAMETQLEIFQSEKIAREVIKKLRLSEDPEFIAAGRGLKARLLGGLVGSRERPTEAERIERARAFLGKRLTVSRVGMTYAIEVGFESNSADRAAQVANAVVEAYIDQQLASQYNATRQASDWLGARIGELREQSAAAQQAVVNYKAKNNIVEAGGGELVNQRLAELNSQLAIAHANAIEAKAKLDHLDAITSADPSDSSIVNSSFGDDAKNEILNKLRMQYLELANRETEWSAQYGRDHLAVVNLRNQMLQIRSAMLDQFKQLKETARSEFELAQLREAGVEKELAKTISQSEANSQAQVGLRQLEASAKTYQTLYGSFLNRYTDSVQEQTSPIAEASFINRARPPDSRNYKKTLIAAAAFPVAGLALGFGIALLRELGSRVFWTSKLVESTLRVACLGILPNVGGPKNRSEATQAPSDGQFHPRMIRRSGVGWTVVDQPFSRFSEGIRSIRLAVDTDAKTKSNKVIGFTSALPSEGKSTVAVAFGQLVARTGARAIVVDCDLRNPSLTRSLAPDAKRGILQLIAEQASLEEVIYTDVSTRMDFLPAVLRPNLAEPYDILSSDRTKLIFDELRRRYEFVVVDFSPLAPVIDVCATTHLVDSYILVVEWGRTKIDIVEHALRAAPGVSDALLGAVLNKVDIDRLVSYEPQLSTYYFNKEYMRYGYSDT